MSDTLNEIPWTLIFLVLTIVVAIATAAYVAIAERARQKVVERLGTDYIGDTERLVARLLLNPEEDRVSRLATWLQETMPTEFLSGEKSAQKLIHAGFDDAAAPVLFGAIRVASLLFFPMIALALGPRDDALYYLFGLLIAIVVGLFGPPAVLDRFVTARTDRIRKAVPDALDLLVVCVEAGVSLDAAMIRTSRDMYSSHPDMAMEMAHVVRRVNAGMVREQALQSLHRRTGVDELRTLVASMVQCERLGTSIGRVLRVNAETLRQRRRQRAEKRAAQAALKMTIPLAFLILPALMVVVLGPAALQFMKEFK
ncbi:MAG: type II secretion system F family protein [Gemmatimonadaceae bacterium]|nr:type II secretion system F family protein [Gemmatimonadaceae bacterium]